MIIPNQKHLFNIPGDVTYLNCSNMSPLLRSVREAAIQGIEKRGSPWGISIDDWFTPADELKGLFAKIINSPKGNVALIPSASYGIAVAARNIKLNPNQNIVILGQQYPSNVYAWRQLANETGAQIIIAEKHEGQTWTDALLNTINGATGIVAVPNCHWTNGSFINLHEVSKRTHQVGAALVIDASQSLGAYPLNIEDIKPDFFITVGYKWLLGPYGLGYLYASDKYCRDGEPIEYTWLNKPDAENFTALVEYRDDYKPGAARFNMGEYPSFINIPMAIAALTQVLEWGVDNIQESLSVLTTMIHENAERLGFRVPATASRVGHMTGIQFSEQQASALAKQLTANKIFISFRGTSMRISPHLYNSAADVEKLFDVLKNALHNI